MRRINILTTVLIALLAAVGGAYFANPDGFKDTLRSKELYSSTRVADATPNYTAQAFNATAPAAGEAVKAEADAATATTSTTPDFSAAPAAPEATPAVTPAAEAAAPVAAAETPALTPPMVPTPSTPAPEKKQFPPLDIVEQMADHVLGSPDAPLTIYDYSSLSCPHCGNFHNTILPKVKQYYIDTGKVRWVFRTFPHNEAALRAEMLARCQPRDQYLKFEDMMFANQERWAFSSTPLPNLSTLVRVAGVDYDRFEFCTTNKELEAAVLRMAQEGTEKYKIGSTPTFVINDGEKKLEGGGTYETFAYELDTLLERADTRAKAAAQSTPVPGGKL